MTNDRRAEIMSVVSVTLTVAEILLVVIGRHYGRNLPELLQAVAYIVFYEYLLGAPLCAVFALVKGERSKSLVRTNYLVLSIWVIFLGWTLAARPSSTRTHVSANSATPQPAGRMSGDF
jgi:hypothetical protein